VTAGPGFGDGVCGLFAVEVFPGEFEKFDGHFSAAFPLVGIGEELLAFFFGEGGKAGLQGGEVAFEKAAEEGGFEAEAWIFAGIEGFGDELSAFDLPIEPGEGTGGIFCGETSEGVLLDPVESIFPGGDDISHEVEGLFGVLLGKHLNEGLLQLAGDFFGEVKGGELIEACFNLTFVHFHELGLELHEGFHVGGHASAVLGFGDELCDGFPVGGSVGESEGVIEFAFMLCCRRRGGGGFGCFKLLEPLFDDAGFFLQFGEGVFLLVDPDGTHDGGKDRCNEVEGFHDIDRDHRQKVERCAATKLPEFWNANGLKAGYIRGMKVLSLLLLPLMAFGKELPLLPLPVSEPEKMGVSAEGLARIGPVVEALISEKKLAGGSVLVMRKGRIVYLESFGYRDVEAGKLMEADTLFRIYSMTKGLTSVAALMLCEEGKLSLDDPIDFYFPVFKSQDSWRMTTVRDLLRHTSGFVKRPEGDMPLLKMVDDLAKGPMDYEPGTQWVYGVSSDLLAAVVAKVSGKPFEQFLQERLLTPLGMRDTGYVVPEEKRDRLSVHYRAAKGELKVIDPAEGSTYLKNPQFKGGGSGLVSTITDYGRFLQMIASGGEFQGKRYLRKDTVDLMRTNQLPLSIPCIGFGEQVRHGTGFGLGFCVRCAKDDRWDKDAAMGEYGWGGAASTHYWISPEHELVVITMEQTMPFNWNLERTLKPIIYKAIEKTLR
jgi:CubicO group peptidase (beta-lactamase class C family)